ncbi:hypothetical protein SS50377_21521 [Spironucleus salmonicida]|uniref:Uncharacterized protein n=1 Tax=Spironucleus salmonicida TaxID=348837 RepID=V6LLG5_9EUKA|nr:hypothetical protein SS50377_21521 [Spironucleus salmonicida]|eukprot:EST45500.1 Hypothetical protein SS50377_14572 [Spironucleus salmonicida]
MQVPRLSLAQIFTNPSSFEISESANNTPLFQQKASEFNIEQDIADQEQWNMQREKHVDLIVKLTYNIIEDLQVLNQVQSALHVHVIHYQKLNSVIKKSEVIKILLESGLVVDYIVNLIRKITQQVGTLTAFSRKSLNQQGERLLKQIIDTVDLFMDEAIYFLKYSVRKGE